jgi:uncharacterized protein (UPF0333 family)
MKEEIDYFKLLLVSIILFIGVMFIFVWMNISISMQKENEKTNCILSMQNQYYNNYQNYLLCNNEDKECENYFIKLMRLNEQYELCGK